MDVLEICTRTPRDPLLVHKAGHVGRNDVLGAVALMIVYFVESHAC